MKLSCVGLGLRRVDISLFLVRSPCLGAWNGRPVMGEAYIKHTLPVAATDAMIFNSVYFMS